MGWVITLGASATVAGVGCGASVAMGAGGGESSFTRLASVGSVSVGATSVDGLAGSSGSSEAAFGSVIAAVGAIPFCSGDSAKINRERILSSRLYLFHA